MENSSYCVYDSLTVYDGKTRLFRQHVFVVLVLSLKILNDSNIFSALPSSVYK